MINYFTTKQPRIYNGERITSLGTGAGKIGQLHVGEQNWSIILHHKQKSTQNGFKDLNTKPKTIKLLKENIGW